MKKFALIIALIIGLLSTTIILSHYFPQKVPKQIGGAIPMDFYKKIPRQVREFLPWMKPTKGAKPQYVNIQELNAKVAATLAQDQEEQQKNAVSQSTQELLQQTLENFYQKMAEGNFNDSYSSLHSVSQQSLSGSNFVNYYSLLKDTFEVQSLTVGKDLVKVPEFKDPTSGKVIKSLIKAPVTFTIADHFTVTKAIEDKVTKQVFFAQENGQWRIVETTLNNDNITQERYYYFVDEGFKRLKYKDSFGAIDFFRKAIRENKLSINANYGLAAALYEIAYYDRAIETVQKMESIYQKKYVTKLVVDNIDLKTVKKLDQERLSNGYYVMGSALIRKGYLAEAKYSLQKVLQLNPTNEFAQVTLKTIPAKIAAKTPQMLYKDEGQKIDPFKDFREGKTETASKPNVLEIDPEQAVNILKGR